MMLGSLAAAALRTLLLAGAVQLCLRLLRVRRPHLLLTCWTAVLAVSLAMPLLQQVMRLPMGVTLPAADLAGLGDADLPDATSLPAGMVALGRLGLPWRPW